MDNEEKVEILCEWIEALAAADFRKATGQLAIKGARCCLGVLRDVAGTNESDRSSSLNYETLLKTVDQVHLARINDMGSTHPQIASIILKDLGDYFDPDTAEGISEHFWGVKQ